MKRSALLITFVFLAFVLLTPATVAGRAQQTQLEIWNAFFKKRLPDQNLLRPNPRSVICACPNLDGPDEWHLGTLVVATGFSTLMTLCQVPQFDLSGAPMAGRQCWDFQIISTVK